MTALARAGLLGLVLAVAVATPASAHAELESTSPERGRTLERQPAQVAFAFSEAVEASFGAVRVFDARARRVDEGDVVRPGGRDDAIAVRLRGGLPDGSYTATYRVISADGHPVSGGLVFSVGAPGAGPAKTVDELLGDREASTATRAVFDLARGLSYAALAAGVGALIFLLACWRGGLAAAAGAGPDWAAASAALAARARRLLLAAAGLGVASGLGVLAGQGAIAGGTGVGAALDPAVLRDVAGTHLGRAHVAGMIAWAALGAVTALARAPRRVAALRPATLGATGQALERPGGALLARLALPAAALLAVPALAGHASTQSPRGLLVVLDVVHVTAMAAWLGGLTALLVLVPVATRRLAAGERAQLLAAVLLRFSPLALACVAALLVTGTVQGLLHLGGLGHLLDDTYGLLLLAKLTLIGLLVVLGAVNRGRLVPRLRAAASRGDAPGGAGLLLRGVLRAEVALVVVVLGVTSVLVTQPPPSTAAAGPQTVERRLGPLDLTLTLDPARTGPNELHLYLFRARDGAPFDGTRELTLRAALPARGIEQIDVTLREAGPGHYLADAVALQPAGDWRLDLVVRVGEFDQLEASARVEVR